jgi:hypothetical protein
MARALKQKDINLLTLLTRPRERGRLRLAEALTALALVGIIVAACVATISHQYEMSRLARQTEGVEASLRSTLTISQLKAADESQRLKDSTASAAEAVASIDNLATYPDLDWPRLAAVFELSGQYITISDVSYDHFTGLLRFKAASSYVAQIPRYVRDLRASGLFSDLSYDGYDGTRSLAHQTQKTTKDGTVVIETWYEDQYVFNFLGRVALAPAGEAQSGGAGQSYAPGASLDDSNASGQQGSQQSGVQPSQPEPVQGGLG